MLTNVLTSAIIVILTASAVSGQTPTLALNSDQLFVDPGTRIKFALTLSSSVDVAALQFRVETSSATQVTEWTTPLTGKQIQCQENRCVISGLNKDAIPPGAIAEATFEIWEDTSFTLNWLKGASPDGQPIEILAGQIIQVSLYSPWDYDKDGQLTIADYNLGTGLVLRSLDLSYTIVDLQLAVNAIVAAGV